MKAYEIIEHTADVGLRIHGSTGEELFCHAALGLADLITDTSRLHSLPLDRKISFGLQGENTEDLFLKWLREILFVFSTRKLILLSFDFKILTAHRLQVEAQGLVFDPEKHESNYEVKAVTYHGFKMEKTKSGFEAEVIFDI